LKEHEEDRLRRFAMTQEWPAEIARAQKLTHYPLGEQMLPRIRYGEESNDWHAERVGCHDCIVIKGQFHVPGCDVEECPNCHGQLISCDCEIVDTFSASSG
jgi:hypothetical protein